MIMLQLNHSQDSIVQQGMSKISPERIQED